MGWGGVPDYIFKNWCPSPTAPPKKKQPNATVTERKIHKMGQAGDHIRFILGQREGKGLPSHAGLESSILAGSVCVCGGGPHPVPQLPQNLQRVAGASTILEQHRDPQVGKPRDKVGKSCRLGVEGASSGGPLKAPTLGSNPLLN